jgi:hypothetical protein
MEFTITLREMAGGWRAGITTDAFPGWSADTRILPAGAAGFPHPPATERESWLRLWQDVCADLTDAAPKRLYESMLAGDPDPKADEVVRFGGYLGAVLLGPWWDAIMRVMPTGPLDLRLDIAAADAALQRLPWEMTMIGNKPLAALPDPKRRIAITRLIHPDPPPRLHPIALPLRVLFVVGEQMDERLRPGAEYLALLREFSMQDAGAAAGTAVQTRLVLQTKRQALQAAIDDFCPSVVHIVAHGRFGASGPEILLTSEDSSRSEGEPIGASALAVLLRGNSGEAPPVQVVLVNACHSGEPDGSYLSFAADLVAAGIPIAAGMSGEIADGACRIFTRAFYRGLIDCADLDVACAEGRRAAVLFYKEVYTASVEWARPTLFRAAGAVLRVERDEPRIRQARAAARFRVRSDEQILCGRMDALQVFQEACTAVRCGGRMGLAFEVAGREEPADSAARLRRLGKTWLLNELAAQAALEGFVPCVLPNLAAVEVPGNFLLMAMRLAEAMDDTREKFDCPRRYVSSAQRTAFKTLKMQVTLPAVGRDDPDYDDQVADAKQRLRDPPPRGAQWADQAAVEAAIRRDLEALVADVAPGAPAMILVDDLHIYEGAALPFLAALKTYGFGSLGKPASLVFTYLTGEKYGPSITEALASREGEIRRAPLREFIPGVERTLAYRQYILLSRRYALTTQKTRRTEFQKWLTEFCEPKIRGVPSYLRELNDLTVGLHSLGYLVEADDEKIIRHQREADRV